MQRASLWCAVVVCLIVGASGGGNSRLSAQAIAVPSPWTARDIGSPAIAGSSSFDQASGSFTVNAAGEDIWGTVDQFHFISQPVTGDFVMTARVNSVSYAHAWSKAGLMVRRSLTAGSAHGFALVSAGKGTAFQRRTADGGLSTHTAGSLVAPPQWVRLARSGAVVTASASADGSAWSTIGSDTIALGATAYVGIAATSHNVSLATTAVVSNVKLVQAGGALPTPQQAQDIGSPAVAGSSAYTQGVYTVAGAGRDIWNSADQFQYVYQPISGDADIKVRLSSIGDMDRWSKAGVMIRQSLTPGSTHALAGVSAEMGYLFQRRPTTNGLSVHTAGGAGAAPGWVRLKRAGSLLTAYRSADGVNWTVMGSDSIPMTDPVYAGIAVTSHNTLQATTALLDNLVIAQSSAPPPPPSNQSPTVTLTAPASGATFTAPGTVTMAATAADADGTIARVDFYAGSTFLFRDTAAPFTYTWSGVAAGTYGISAIAYDNANLSATSATATVTVGTSTANRPPTVTLTAPANGATFTAPGTVTIAATAADTDGSIARVDFYAGSTFLFRDTAAPFTYTWSSVAAGTYGIKAIAYDNANASATSSTATITVGTSTANRPPTVTLTAPANGATFTAPGTVTIAATAADTDGTIARVDFYAGSTFLFRDTAAPFAYTWSGVAAGTYGISAIAYDNANASATSSTATVTVGTSTANRPPTVTLTAPANGATLTAPGTVTMTAAAADTDGTIARVDFYAGSTFLFRDTAAPFAYTWSGVAAGTYGIKAIAYDNANASATSATATITVGTSTSNRAPTVTLTAPTTGGSYTAPATVTLTATAADADGTIARVDFYAGSTFLFRDTAAPYAYTWSGVAAGTYGITAIAYDNANASATSAVATITVSSSATLLPPKAIAFQASADHATGVTSYRLDIFASGANPSTAAPIATSDLGKPQPDSAGVITVDRATFFSALPIGSYIATVSAIGPAGTSRSSPLTFTR